MILFYFINLILKQKLKQPCGNMKKETLTKIIRFSELRFFLLIKLWCIISDCKIKWSCHR